MSKMYVYSTLATDQKYSTEAGDVLIAGKANVSNKHLLTPAGVVTPVEEDVFEALMQNKVFQAHARNGFLTATQSKADADEVAGDMNPDDKGQQDTVKRIKRRGRGNAAPVQEGE